MVGGLLGYALHHPPRTEAGRESIRRHSGDSKAGSAGRNAASEEQRRKDEQVLLGDLASIPFQELYEILARQRPEEIALLAKQLQQLPPGQQAEARIKAFFTAWAHLDPNSAFTSALDLRNSQARISAIGAII